MDNEGTTLATELLKELKASARRWFIAFLVMLGIEIATIIAFLWYISLPIDETVTTQTIEDVNSGSITQQIGDSYGENEANSQAETQSNEAEAITE